MHVGRAAQRGTGCSRSASPRARPKVRCASPSRPWVDLDVGQRDRAAEDVGDVARPARAPQRAPRSRGGRRRGRRCSRRPGRTAPRPAALVRSSSCRRSARARASAWAMVPAGSPAVEGQRRPVHLDRRRDPRELVAVDDDQLVAGQPELPLDVVATAARRRRTRCWPSRPPTRPMARTGRLRRRRREARRPSRRITRLAPLPRAAPGWPARPGRRLVRRHRRRGRAGPPGPAHRLRRTRRWPGGAARRALGPLGEQVRAEHVGEQVVVAVPAPLVVERNHEQVPALQRLQHLAARRRPGDGVAQRAGQPVEDRGVEQEVADARRAAGRGPPRRGSRRRSGRRRRSRR